MIYMRDLQPGEYAGISADAEITVGLMKVQSRWECSRLDVVSHEEELL
jgi:hypothetical protein